MNNFKKLLMTQLNYKNNIPKNKNFYRLLTKAVEFFCHKIERNLAIMKNISLYDKFGTTRSCCKVARLPVKEDSKFRGTAL